LKPQDFATVQMFKTKDVDFVSSHHDFLDHLLEPCTIPQQLEINVVVQKNALGFFTIGKQSFTDFR